MVEINNQRKGVLDMWSRELITDVRKRNHGYDTSCNWKLLLITPITLANLSR